MADEKKAPETKPADAPAAPKKRFPLKMLLALGGVLLLEVVTVVVVFALAGGPKTVSADQSHTGAAALAEDGNKETEELVIQDRFANSRRGDVYLYDTEVYVVVRKRHQEKVKEQLKGMSAQIHADIATIFRRADPSFMHEDELQILSRQIKAALDLRFGPDPAGEPIVLRVLMTKCTEYRIDF
jgi:hypothetical protein